MALINSQSIVEDGLTTTRTALAATSNTFTNSGKEFIYINNGSGSSITVTVVTEVTSVENNIYGILAKSNSVVTVAAGVVAMIGTFPVSSYNGDDSIVTFTVSSYTSIEAAILYIG
tara:strand:+ start:55 stop:402 length:348 start_codon:yes stop_codon:yes gene_type:complete